MMLPRGVVKCIPRLGLIAGFTVPPLTLICTVKSKGSRILNSDLVVLEKHDTVELVIEPTPDTSTVTPPSVDSSPPTDPLPPSDPGGTQDDPESPPEDDKQQEEEPGSELNSGLISLSEGLSKAFNAVSGVNDFLKSRESELSNDGFQLVKGYEWIMDRLGFPDSDSTSSNTHNSTLLADTIKKLGELLSSKTSV